MPPVSSAPGDLACRTAAAWADVASRGTVRATGTAAAVFVDKFTTAAIGTLSPGEGAEGMFADVRGWVIALAAILRTDDGLLIDCDAAIAATLRDHLEHYHIREDVALVDATHGERAVAIIGPAAARWLMERVGGDVPAKLLRHRTVRCGGIDGAIVAVDWFGAGGFLVRVARADVAALHDWLATEGLPRADTAALDAMRIEQRFPMACDIPEKTLPQELDRNARAISFTKGCYLGQETVARIDALGHVNRTLSLIAVEGDDVPPPGAAVSSDGHGVGTLTSSCWSPQLGVCGLAIVHRRGLEPGATLTVSGRTAHIVNRDSIAGA
jgi:folate-binding Fe-S cluster repair protein YgfZ